jgi:hypothetical protein
MGLKLDARDVTVADVCVSDQVLQLSDLSHRIFAAIVAVRACASVVGLALAHKQREPGV